MEAQEFSGAFLELLLLLQEGHNEADLIGAFEILIKLFEKLIFIHNSSIIMNPFEEKFRKIKTSNKLIISTLLKIENIELLLEGIGYERIGTSEYQFKSTNISRIAIILPILQDKIFQFKLLRMSPEERTKEIEIRVKESANNQARKRQMALKECQRKSYVDEIESKAKLDRVEKAQAGADQPYVRGKSLQFGAKQNTFKDIGIDLNKNKGG